MYEPSLLADAQVPKSNVLAHIYSDLVCFLA